jgi:hypothetical protein
LSPAAVRRTRERRFKRRKLRRRSRAARALARCFSFLVFFYRRGKSEQKLGVQTVSVFAGPKTRIPRN